jgi:hypothetical protein
MVIMTETGCVLCEVLANEEENVQDLNVTQNNYLLKSTQLIKTALYKHVT